MDEVMENLHIARLHLTPGDVLVVKTDRRTTPEIDKRIRTRLADFLPQGVKALIIDDSIQLSVSFRYYEEGFVMDRRTALSVLGVGAVGAVCSTVASSKPLRLSSRQGDPGYEPWLRLAEAGRYPKVFLDDVEQSHVETADETEGMIVRCILDEGEVFVIETGGKMTDHVAIEVVYGRVRIEV